MAIRESRSTTLGFKSIVGQKRQSTSVQHRLNSLFREIEIQEIHMLIYCEALSMDVLEEEDKNVDAFSYVH